ncbi:MAG: hypothetical protein ABI165_19100 [Bryobacteraceae bacterium]
MADWPVLDWEDALADLERISAGLHAFDLANPARAREILDRRNTALAAVAKLCGESLAAVPDSRLAEIRQRLGRVLEGGNLAAAQWAFLKQQASREWNRWEQLRRALNDARPVNSSSRIDCTG